MQEQVCLQTRRYQQDIEALKTEISELKSSQKFLWSKYDQLKNNYEFLIKENKVITQKIDFNRNPKVTVKQYRRRRNLAFKSVPQIKGEDANQTFTSKNIGY